LLILAHIRTSFAAAFFPRLSEWYCATMLTALGWVLIVNETLMQPDKPGYKLMLAIAPQDAWGPVMMAFGMGRLIVLFINGAWRRSPHARGIAAFVFCFFWYQIATSFWPIMGYVFVLSAGLFVLDFVNLVRAFGDARIVDHAYQKGRQTGGYDRDLD